MFNNDYNIVIYTMIIALTDSLGSFTYLELSSYYHVEPSILCGDALTSCTFNKDIFPQAAKRDLMSARE